MRARSVWIIGICVLLLCLQPASAQSPRGQAWLEKQVRHQLVMLPWYSVFDNLEFRVQGDTIYLEGQVARPVVKQDAEAAVSRIEGVRRVVNNIQVLPLSPMDDRIRVAEYRHIFSAPGFEKYSIQPVPPIHIVVNNGHVALEGVVDSEMDKNLANIRANEVPGVFSVTNHLRLEK